uniref:Spondin-like TSP1 domain-containing protein n=1 Tax=viral metagenome TaxID=1070528 RepID=A0A6C0LZB8_9ZZZZ
MNLIIIGITILVIVIILYVLKPKKIITNTPTNTPTNTSTNISSNTSTNISSNTSTNISSNTSTNIPSNTPSNTPTNTNTNTIDTIDTITPSNTTITTIDVSKNIVLPTISPINCVGNWSEWTQCDKICGSGTKNRTYNIITIKNSTGQDCPVADKTIDTSSCNLQQCPQDCQVSAWSLWSTCSKTCGSGTRYRTRTVTSSTILNGATCPTLREEEPCNTQACPINCTVSDWSDWSTCSKTCGGGTQSITRTIKTQPANGGTLCPALSENISCNTQACPINCAVSDWSNWSTCDKTCGGGAQTRTRTITTQPANGGTTCPALSENISCNTQACPIDCTVSDWSNWSTCDKTCGGGTQTRSRTINTQPANGGTTCPPLSENITCNTQACRTDCAVSDWSNWSTCKNNGYDVTCGGGTRTRSKTIITQPTNGGTPCPNLSETIMCNTQECPSVKSEIGNARGTEFNFACPSGSYITNLYGRSGNWQDAIGAKCSNNQDSGLKGGSGGGIYGIDCSSGFTAMNMKLRDIWHGPYVGTLQPTCGNTQLSMLGIPSDIIQNKDLSCPQGYAINRMFGHYGAYINRVGFECIPKSDNIIDNTQSEYTVCNTNDCPVDCAVSDWSDWSTCKKNGYDVTCDGGIQTRTRTKIREATNGGAICPPLSENIACNTQPCIRA